MCKITAGEKVTQRITRHLTRIVSCHRWIMC